MLPALNLRRAPKANKALQGRKVLRASKARPDRKALTAIKGFRGRKVSASKDRPDRPDCKARREKRAFQDRRLSAKKARPDRKGRRAKQVPQGQPVKLAQQVLPPQQPCMRSGRITVRTTTAHLSAARVRRLFL